ncbi:MAG: hypothetical protein ACPGSD_12160 [Flavobacteriales bacterium]
MQTKAKIKELERLLPHGSKKIIAQRANTSCNSVRAFFNGELKRVDKIQSILTESINYYNELKDREREILNKMTK